MLSGIFFLLLSQLGGEIIARGLGLPVPGPAIGIVLLVAGLAIRAAITKRSVADPGTGIGKAADGLLGNLGLVFVPAGVGISQNYRLVLDNGVALVVALVVSTVLTLIVTMAVFRLVARKTAATEVGANS